MTNEKEERVIFRIPNDGWISQIHCNVENDMVVTFGYPDFGEEQAKKIQVWSMKPKLGDKTICGTTTDIFGTVPNWSEIRLFMKKNSFVLVRIKSPWTENKHNLEHHYRVCQLLPPHTLLHKTKIDIYTGKRGWSGCKLINVPDEEDLMFFNEEDNIIKVISISESRIVKRFEGLERRSYIEAVQFSKKRSGEVYYIGQYSVTRPNPRSNGSYSSYIFFLSKFNYKNPEKTSEPKQYLEISEVEVTRNTSRFLRLDMLEINGLEKLLIFYETKNQKYQEFEERFNWEIYDGETLEKEREILFDDPHVHCISNRFIFFGDGIMYDFQSDLFHDFGEITSLIRYEEIPKTSNNNNKRIKFYIADIFVKNGRFVVVNGFLNEQTNETGISFSEITGSEEIIGLDTYYFKDFLERVEFVKALLLLDDELELIKEVHILQMNVRNGKWMVFKSLVFCA